MESVTPLVSTDGFWGHLTTNQKAALQIFKDKLKTAAADYTAIVTPILKEDIFCLQFLRARKFDINNTIAMVLKYCKWVVDNKIDKIFEFRFPEVSEVRKFYSRGYHRTDRNGRPVYIERVGKIDLKNLFSITTRQRLLRHYIRECAKAKYYIYPICSNIQKKVIEQGIAILDLKDGSSKLFNAEIRSIVQEATAVSQDYFPETMAKMFILNAPFWFRGAWFVIKQFIDSKTVAKISILGSSYKKELEEWVS